ncbi:MAG: hypothetical protein M1825_003896 [Sarcosagium campestre]|nr:MAG: hypothetical protein M1825_003896 [Sarcosagium campestre]
MRFSPSHLLSGFTSSGFTGWHRPATRRYRRPASARSAAIRESRAANECPIDTIRLSIVTHGHTHIHAEECSTCPGLSAHVQLISGVASPFDIDIVEAGRPRDNFCKNIHFSDRRSFWQYDMHAARGTTLRAIMNMIIAKGRLGYQLSSSDLGRRSLVHAILTDLHENGFISAASPVKVSTAINALHYIFEADDRHLPPSSPGELDWISPFDIFV